jgi:AraC-like DNA-binding protein
VAEQHVELAELWGDDGRVLRERLLEAPSPAAALRTVERVLLARAAGSLDPDHALRFAVAALESGASVAQVRDRLGLSVRAMLRAFRDAVGLTPKVYARVRRFQRVLGKAAPAVEPDWADLATSCGYYDQAHLIRDFRELADLTPTAYAPVAPDAHNHAVHRA